MAVQQIPSPQHPVVDAQGKVTTPWYLFLMRLAGAINPGGVTAPSNAGYVVGTADASLPNARVATDSPSVSFDLTTPNQLKATAWVCSPLTDGDLTQPELIFALGDTIAVCT